MYSHGFKCHATVTRTDEDWYADIDIQILIFSYANFHLGYLNFILEICINTVVVLYFKIKYLSKFSNIWEINNALKLYLAHKCQEKYSYSFEHEN